MPYRVTLGRCPRCQENLEPHQLTTGHPVRICERCNGSWMIQKIFRSVCTQMVSATASLEKVGQSDRRCPDCGAPLCVARFEDVEVDTCEVHGIWLDFGELQAIFKRLYRAG